MEKITDMKYLIGAALLSVFTGGLLLLPFGLAFGYVIQQRREELRKKELDDAKGY